MSSRQQIGIGVIGFGWMGQAHSRGFRRVPSFFHDRPADPRLVICSDTLPGQRTKAVEDFGFETATADWREVVDHPDVQIVVVTAPNMLHLEICEAAAAAGKHIFCEKPVGGTPDQTVAAEYAARRAGVITGVGYNYRWVPLVQHTKAIIDSGRIGTITNYRGRFLTMYGSDPLGLLSWRFLLDQAGYGVSTDILSHVVDLAMFLNGPISSVTALGHTFITERPLPKAGGTHYDRGQAGDPTGTVTNEDWFGSIAKFANGSIGTFEVCRSMVGPQSQNTFEIYGTEGSIAWNFEKLNELEVYFANGTMETGYATVFAGDRFPFHGNFVPGNGNGIGFEDLITIEDSEFLRAVADGRPYDPGFSEAVDYVSVQDAMIHSWESGTWVEVVPLHRRDELEPGETAADSATPTDQGAHH